MKKIVLPLAGLLAAAAFAPEASAIPAFARQTGMACSACHQQHFPVLNSFGQAFKAGGYTLMGAQGKVEGEHLSIPDTLNAAMLLKARYQKSNGTDAAGTVSGTTTNGGQWQIPDELSLFFGGRIAENIGFMNENNLVGGPVGGIVAGLKMPIVFEAGSAKFLVIPYLTDSLGVAYGFEQSSTGMARGVRWAEHRKDISAQQYVGVGSGEASGLAMVLINDMGYINLSRWSPNFAFAGGATGVQMSSSWLRIAATPNVGSWNMHIGAGFASGSNYTAGGAAKIDTKATAVDFQGFTQVGGKDLGVYATYASAPFIRAVAGGTTGNAFGSGMGGTTTAYTIGADYSVIPHTLHIGAAYRNAKNGDTATNKQGDNSVTLTTVYDLAQNVALHMNYSARSGSSYGRGGANDTSVVGKEGNSLLTFLLEAAW